MSPKINPAIELREPSPMPNRAEGSVDWDAVAAELKAAKNEWGYVGDFSSGVASHLRAGRYRQFHPHADDPEKARAYMSRHWQVTVRKVKPDNGLYEVYIRWLG